jgi:Na+-transporting methylmalonyl-CoA/oxaloacetate decarboxylase gamma subunit
LENPLIIALVVTSIGMLMLFLSLAFLYGLMVLMTRLIKARPEATAEGPRGAGAEEQGGRVIGEQRAMRQRAAVIAVALARAEMELSPVCPPDAEAGSSPWQQYHRHRLLSLNLRKRITQ